MGLERFLVLIQLSIASLSYEYPSVGKVQTKSLTLKKRERILTCMLWKRSDLPLPAAMTGSLISSLVIGQRNSSGMPTQTESLFSSSTFLRSLLRWPTDSTDKHTQAREHVPGEKTDHHLSIKWNKLN